MSCVFASRPRLCREHNVLGAVKAAHRVEEALRLTIGIRVEVCGIEKTVGHVKRVHALRGVEVGVGVGGRGEGRGGVRGR